LISGFGFNLKFLIYPLPPERGNWSL